jgi:hypothetical protein
MHHDAPKAGKKLLLCSVFGAEYETGVLAKDDSYVDEVTSTWLCHRNIILSYTFSNKISCSADRLLQADHPTRLC